MQQPRPVGSAPAGAPEDGFFIPDLCAPTAVLLAVLLAELVVLLHVLALGSLASFDWRAFATASLFVQWNTLLCLALICALRDRLRSLKPALTAIACLFVVAAVVTVSSLMAQRLTPQPPGEGPPVLDMVLRNALIAVILAAIGLRYSYLQKRVAVQQRSELQLRLDALRSRIRPHFLFNTLNSIASLIAVRPERAEQAVEDVAELFRAALQDAGGDSSFAQERHLCSLYLDLETLRLGERLRVRWDVEEGVDALPLPALLLQPLVENAVYHGIAPRPEGGEICIRARREQGCLFASVENPLPSVPARGAGSGQHMALDNIRQRLDAQFGTEGRLFAEQRGDSYFAELRVPVREAEPA
ncbi:MAG: histidine kinase [Pseudomonadota bacterium]